MTGYKSFKDCVASDGGNVRQENTQKCPDPAKHARTKPWGPGAGGLSFKDALLSTASLPPIYTGSEEEEEDDDLGRQTNLKPRRKAFILKLLGKTMSFTSLSPELVKLWKPKYPLELVELSMNFFQVRFRCTEDYDLVLEKGPWNIMGQYLTIRSWKLDFKPANDVQTSTLVWAKLTGLPVEYCDDSFLFKIGNALGKAVKVDKRMMAIFARICIEVDLNKPLPPCMWIDTFLQDVEYEGLRMICFECGKSGHQREACPRIPTGF